MRQRTTVLFVVGVALLAVLASAVTAAATGLAGIGAESDPVSATTQSDGVSPGQRLAAVIGAQRAEVEGEIETRTFGVRIAVASSSRAKAGVVADQVDQLDRRLDALRNRRAALERARKNSSVSDGAYRAQVTELVVRIESVQRRINATDDVANDLPESDLQAAGVSQSNIAQLRQRATNLTDEETVDTVRSVVDEGVGEGMGDPSSSVLDSVESGNLTSGFVEGNENRTDVPGRRNGRSGENAGNSRNGSVAPGTGANAGSGGETAETATDEATVNETATNTTRETPPETATPTNETAAARATTPPNATATTAGTPPNASGATETRNATATSNTTDTRNATERSPTGASETPPTGTTASATETVVTDAITKTTTAAPSNTTAATDPGTAPSRTANETTAATGETAAGDPPNSNPATSTNETGTAA